MNAISANDLKVKGISAIEGLVTTGEVSVTVRGLPKYIVMSHEQYEYFRECELASALAQSNQDIKDGKFAVESVDAHIARLKAL